MLLVSLWAAVTINFILPRLMPGNPALTLFARYRGVLTTQTLAAMEKQFGFDKDPWIVQYWQYIRSMVTGHLGLSFQYYPEPASTVISQSLPWTVGIVGISTLISVFLGTTLGIYISWRRGRFLDNVLPPTTMFLQAVPYFWMAMVFMFVFAFRLSWFPMSHAYDVSLNQGFNSAYISSILYHAVLPATTIVLGSISGWLIGMRNNMITTLGEDYALFAEAKGVSTARLMFMYAARNAILPQVTAFAIALGNIVSGAILTEIVFSYPGIGNELNSAVTSEDYPMIQASFLIIAISVLTANFVVDLIYSRLDPRVRAGGVAE